MFKRLLLRGALCIGLFALLGTNAHAYPAAPGGWGAWPGSVSVWTDWKGVSNYEIKPTNADVTLFISKVQLHYLNPGGQPGGLGNPFYPDVEISMDGALNDSVSKNGRYQMLLSFDDSLLIELIMNSGAEIPDPPNPQWTLDPEHPVVILEMFVRIRGFSDFDDKIIGTETETAHVAGPCTLNYDGTDYTCVTEEEWNWKKNNPVCPYCPYEGEEE